MKCGNFIFIKAPMKFNVDKEIIYGFQYIVPEELAVYMKKKKKLDQYLTPYTEINSRWDIDLNIKIQSKSLLKENTG